MAEKENLLAGSKTIFPFPFPNKFVPTSGVKVLGPTTPGTISAAKVDEATLKEVKETLNENWSDIEGAFQDVVRTSKRNYNIIIVINIAIAAAGMVLLSSSIIHSWIRGIDLFSTITSAIAIADFVTVFLINPQTKIRKVLGDLVQIQMIYRAWINQVFGAYSRLVSDNYTPVQIQSFQNDLKMYTKESVELIGNNIGKD